MADNYAPLDSESNGVSNNGDHGWQKVTYAKKHKKNEADGDDYDENDEHDEHDEDDDYEYDEYDEHDEHYDDENDENDENDEHDEHDEHDDDENDEYDEYDEDSNNGKAKEIKKVTVAEAAAQIDASDLEAFLGDISAAFEQNEIIQMKRFADYFEHAFTDVTAYYFPWVKLFRKKPLSKTVDAPIRHISDAVYKTSVDWIHLRSPEALSFFLLWSLNCILDELRSQLTEAKHEQLYEANKYETNKDAKKAMQLTSKSSVEMFVCLAMVLRRKPDALISVLPELRDNTKYQGRFQVLAITWMVAQASVGDLSVGLYAWSRNLLPIVVGKSGNPQSRDFVLQLVEKILSTPEARPVLVNGAVRKGEQLIPPRALETLIRVTFPSSNRLKIDVQATKRFALIYPILREVALGGSPGSKAIKRLFSFAIEAAGEDNPELSTEAVGIVICCLSRSTKCYKQWEKVYEYNIVASVAILKKLSDDLEVQATKLSPYEPLRKILKLFRQKNKKALATETGAAHHAHFKDADKYCKIIAGRVSQGLGCKACLTFGVLAAAVVLSFCTPIWNL
ncbi:hypothetical protein P8452_30047 [Trifolium repens]|nr:hypothetical protein P8452_30047 [Trifolium repens]